DVLRALEAHIAGRGFAYPPLTVRTCYLCLQTRPLVLLSGLSGTGKTHLTFLIAEALTGNTGEQYRLIPVRPDWADSSPLLGYVNYLARGGEGRYIIPPFLQFLQQAARPENAHRAFFLCLDEMNLARAEHYLAEVLSAMEAPTRILLLPDGTGMPLPPNLFLTGTLNLDDATHPLSRRTLDRASVLTFSDVHLDDPATPPAPATDPPFALRQAVFLHTRIQDVQEARSILTRIPYAGDTGLHRVLRTLSEAHRLLEQHGLSFAYRVRDDALRFCARSFDCNGQGLLAIETPDDPRANLHIALDLFLTTRVLPRLSGPAEQVDPPARELLQWATEVRFQHAATRLERFLHRLQRTGFASMDEV
ncbi:MAG: hypothetical protein RMJ43_01240, partial [Chloroherpetonaceae bacterium]|nr:AAA family ATPase [Chthonomonadaceae bacterium]MDW8206432.1 hypothetical protein [Chloroherpetonaceae bacterium]